MNTENHSEMEMQELAIRKIRGVDSTNEYEDWNPEIDEYIRLFEDLATMEKPQLDAATKNIIMSEILANNELEVPSHYPALMIWGAYSLIALLGIGIIASIVGMDILLTSVYSILIISTAATFLLIAIRDAAVSYQYKLKQL